LNEPILKGKKIKLWGGVGEKRAKEGGKKSAKGPIK